MVGKFYGSTLHYSPEPGVEIKWKKGLPVDVPSCGFSGELCIVSRNGQFKNILSNLFALPFFLFLFKIQNRFDNGNLFCKRYFFNVTLSIYIVTVPRGLSMISPQYPLLVVKGDKIGTVLQMKP